MPCSMWDLPKTGIELMSLTLTSRQILNHWTTSEILFFLFKTAGKVRVSLVAQKVIHLQCGRPGSDPWVGKIP